MGKDLQFLLLGNTTMILGLLAREDISMFFFAVTVIWYVKAGLAMIQKEAKCQE